MDKKRRIVTVALGLLLGLVGLCWIFVGFIFLEGILGQSSLVDRIGTLPIAAYVWTIGALHALIGFQAVLKDTETTVKRLCGLLGFTAYTLLNTLLDDVHDVYVPGEIEPQAALIMFGPVVFGVLVYRIAISLLRQKQVPLVSQTIPQ